MASNSVDPEPTHQRRRKLRQPEPERYAPCVCQDEPGGYSIYYCAVEDRLTVLFGAVQPDDDGVSLNDHVTVYCDRGWESASGFEFVEYGRMLRVSETEFTALAAMREEDIAQMLTLLGQPPASTFFDITDPVNLIARVQAPRLDELIVGA